MNRERNAKLLAILFGLFLGRVLGQLAVVIFSPRFLPPHGAWMSGALGYVPLFCIQVLMLFLGGYTVSLVTSGRMRPRPALGRGLKLVSILYLLATSARAISYVLFSLGLTKAPLMQSLLPIPFHFVIASFLYISSIELGASIPGRALVLAVALTTTLSACSVPSYYLETQTDLPKSDYLFTTQKNASFKTVEGLSLQARIYRPAREGKYPSILVRAPFPEGTKTELMLEGIGRLWSRRGYAVVIQGTRGTLGSEGDSNQLFVHERQDGIATLRWLTSQEFYNGEVFSWGGSYFSYTQWSIADQVELKGMISQIGGHDFGSVLEPGGSFALESSLFWAYRDGWTLPKRTVLQEAAEVWPRSPEGAARFLEDWRTHRGDTEYWQERRAITPENSTAPALLMAGWFDPFLSQQIEQFQSLRQSPLENVRKNSSLVIGPWQHAQSTLMPEGYAPPSYRLASIEPTIRWLNALRNESADEEFPPVRYFTTGSNEWRSASNWPPVSSKSQKFIFNATNAYTKDRSKLKASFWHKPQSPIPSKGGASLGYRAGIEEQGDIAKAEGVLTFDSPILMDALEVTGNPEAVLYVESSACSADFIVKVVDVFPDGTSYNISEGVQRVDNCTATQKRLRQQKTKIPMQAMSRVFFKGHRLRVLISSSSFPLYEVNPNKAKQGVFLGKHTQSHIVLPTLRKQNLNKTTRAPFGELDESLLLLQD